MIQVPRVIGIVCSGNTCRSPIAAAWVTRAVSMTSHANSVRVWTAGMRIDDPEDVGQKPVEPYALLVAWEMLLSRQALKNLREHRVRDLNNETEPTTLLVWITDPSKMENTDCPGSRYLTRRQVMEHHARRLHAELFVIQEADDAWEAKNHEEPPWEILRLYREQGKRLQDWSQEILRRIPHVNGSA